jgi:transcriptional regulator with XRE-family HTH domain
MPAKTNIRDLRESKNLSQDKVAEAAGLTYSVFVRVEAGSGKTTPEEVGHVLAILKDMEDGTRKLAGRPFGDAKKQAAVEAARAAGTSVADAMGIVAIEPAKSLGDMTVVELREKAKQTAGVELKARASKAELVEALSQQGVGKSDLATALGKKKKTKA